MKRISWKATAKTNKLYSMEFDPALYFPVLVLLNFSVDDYPARQRESLVERAAETAASAVVYFTGLKQEIGFVSSGIVNAGKGQDNAVQIQYKKGYEHTREILKVIAMLEAARGTADFNGLLFGTNTALRMGARVVVVSPRLSHRQVTALVAARKRGVNVQILRVESAFESSADSVEAGVPVIPISNGREQVFR
jgi:uncharacterized protein (DUF58 family)